MKEVAKAISAKAELDKLRPIKEEDEIRIMQKFRLDWNYHSNNIEGNSLTYGETKALILFGITAQGKPLKDHFEVTGHDEAIKWVLDIVKEERPLNESFIRQLHKLILKEPYYVDAITPVGDKTKKRINIGVYKETPNHVKTRTGEIFRFSTPEEMPMLMSELINWYRIKSKENEINPIILAAEFHYRFIRIHPFDDGNGRTVRILMNFILLKFGYPPVVIKTEDKKNYFSVLQQADTGNLEPFFEYIARNLNDSLDIMVKGAKGESIEEDDDIDKEISILERKLNNLSNPINQSRSLQSKQNAYDILLIPLLTKFVEKCSLLDKFYVKNKLSLKIGTSVTYYSKEEIIDISKRRLTNSVNELHFNYHYEGFNQKGFVESHFSSRISIAFSLTRITIKSPSVNGIAEKLYGEEFTEDEILELVGAEIKRHRLHIERLIKHKT